MLTQNFSCCWAPHFLIIQSWLRQNNSWLGQNKMTKPQVWIFFLLCSCLFPYFDPKKASNALGWNCSHSIPVVYPLIGVKLRTVGLRVQGEYTWEGEQDIRSGLLRIISIPCIPSFPTILTSQQFHSWYCGSLWGNCIVWVEFRIDWLIWVCFL